MARIKLFDTKKESIEALTPYVEENKRIVEEIFSKNNLERSGNGFEISYLIELFVIEDDNSKGFYFNQGVLGISNEGSNLEYGGLVDLVNGIKETFKYQKARSLGAKINPILFTVKEEDKMNIKDLADVFLPLEQSFAGQKSLSNKISYMVERGLTKEEIIEFEKLSYKLK